MSVPQYKQTPSKVEFLSTFHKLRKEINLILMRDFGIKKRTYNVTLISDIYELSDEDKKVLEEITLKYGIDSVLIDKYSEWLVSAWRNETREILTNLGVQIELANSIYITCKEEYFERRIAWDKAIGYCNALKDKFHEILSTIKVSVGAYKVVAELLQKEINLLKGVRKSDNQILTKLS